MTRVLLVDDDEMSRDMLSRRLIRRGFEVIFAVAFRSESTPVQMPNMIWLYRRAILDYWAEHDETLGAIVKHVLVHEIGHHFGFSDAGMEVIEASVDDAEEATS